ncbi:hypothetical protein SAMN05444972_10841 [Marininema halotolerans]|uniref:Uncharacterized protein n=1 Tax=Marininema halotolerans TaxID=1155944 RepID=A0A1I6SUB7_9BACL|nr:hypothetical protein SAMN05444972_10841 [Marininema halotolerans]
MKNILLRKSLALMGLLLILLLLINIIPTEFNFDDKINIFLMYLFYLGPVLIIFVLPVSVLSDFISKKYQYRWLISFFIHMTFSFIPFLIIPLFSTIDNKLVNSFVFILYYTLNITFLLYWLMDELFLRLWSRRVN